MSTAIRLRDVSASYDKLHPSLSHLNLDLEPGKIIGLLGPNGCGKTTLLKILAGVFKNYQGSVELFGQAPGSETKAFVSYLPDRWHLPDTLRPQAALKMYSDFFPDFDTALAQKLVTTFGLDQTQDTSKMSKGMKEKLAIALTMARQAKIYLLDEPMAGVDPVARDEILRTIIAHFRPDALLLISTHLIQDIEPVLDDVLMMQNGRFLLYQSVDNLRKQYGLNVNETFKEVNAK